MKEPEKAQKILDALDALKNRMTEASALRSAISVCARLTHLA